MGAHLKALLADSTKLIKVFALGQLCSPKFVEMVAWSGGFDAVWLDQEHVGLTVGQIEEAARAARGCGLDSFVRLAPTDYATVMRPLEAGAGGIMASMVRSARQAEEIVTWARFHPRGLRGVNGTGVDGGYGTLGADYFGRASYGAIRGVALTLQVVAQAVGPLLSGALRDWTGDYTWSLTVFGAFAALAAVVALAARRPVS